MVNGMTRRAIDLLVTLIVGAAGGVLGRGVLSTRSGPEAVVRAHRIELVDQAGRPIAFWGFDENDNAVLVFGRRNGKDIHSQGNQVLLLGIHASDNPMLQFRADDGKTRLRLYQSEEAKPILIMEDETGPRIGLGIEQSDTPSRRDNDWSLHFIPEQTRMGMITKRVEGRSYVRGVFHVNREWTPLSSEESPRDTKKE